MVDYDDDDDEDYRPPPRKQTDDEDEATMTALKLKRKLPSNSMDGGPESAKKQRLMNKGGTKSKEGGVFAALCSTLSNAMLPGKKASSPASPQSSSSGDSGLREEEAATLEKSRTTSWTESDDDNHNGKENEKEANGGCTDISSRQLGGGEEIQLVHQPNSPPEMAAANGS